MKKNYLLIALSALLLFQCESIDSPRQQNSSTQLQEAREWYETGKTSDGILKTSKIGFTSAAIWDKAKIYQGGERNNYVITTRLAAYSKTEPQSAFHLFTFLREQKTNGFILQVIPDNDGKKTTGSPFSGRIKMRLGNGKHIRTYNVKAGKATPFINGVVSTFRTMEESSNDNDIQDLGELSTVTIIGYQDAGPTSYVWFSGVDVSWYGNTSWDYGDYNGDGSQDVGVPVPDDELIVEGGPPKRIDDPKTYFKCFNTSAPAKLTIYDDQPVAGQSDSYNAANVGHSYIGIQQGGVVRTIGFYPDGWVMPGVRESISGVLGNDEDISFDVSVTMDISPSELNTLLARIAALNYTTYDLDNYNCTNFVVDVCSSININLPQTQGTWPGGQGLCPGALGQDLRTLTIPGRTLTKSLNGGNSPSNSSPCQ